MPFLTQSILLWMAIGFFTIFFTKKETELYAFCRRQVDYVLVECYRVLLILCTNVIFPHWGKNEELRTSKQEK